MSNVHWFALNVRTRHEDVVATILENKGYEIFLPLYQSRRMWSDRIKELQVPLFPGYVFCRFDTAHRTVPIVTTPGVIRIVGFAGQPVPMDEREIESVRIIARSALPAEPWPYVQAGSPVRITYGSLTGVEGVLVEVKKQHQLVVSINLLQRSVAVQIDKAWVKPLDVRYTAPSTRDDLPAARSEGFYRRKKGQGHIAAAGLVEVI